MKRQLNCVLLVDDDRPTNVMHKWVIQKAECAKEITIAKNGQEALDFLTMPKDGTYIEPELILLDINMPLMNGWEFLESYQKSNNIRKDAIIVVMLTTSLNPDDRMRAEQIDSITLFKNKPLSLPVLEEIMETYFS